MASGIFLYRMAKMAVPVCLIQYNHFNSMNNQKLIIYETPETQVLVIRQESRFLDDSNPGGTIDPGDPIED
jgi:hypothetical protein